MAKKPTTQNQTPRRKATHAPFPKNGDGVLTWARFYRQAWDVYPVPVPPGQKGPTLRGWQNLRLADGDLKRYFPNGSNIGLLLGEPSGGLVDVDLDAPEACAVAAAFLPPTDCVHGRPAKLRSHFWYRCTPAPKTQKFIDPDGTVLLELRSTGGQTLVPNSSHSEESLGWEGEGEPALVDGKELQRAGGFGASAATLARHWPRAKGSRQDFALALAGFLLRYGLDEDAACLLIQMAARGAGDEEIFKRVRTVMDTARKLKDGQPTTGRPTIERLLLGDGKKVVACLQKWLALRGGAREAPGGALYEIKDGRIIRWRPTREGPVAHPLTNNFACHVTEELTLDDGVETTTAFRIEGATDTGEPLPPKTIPAAQFGGMGWVTDRWGLKAIVAAGPATKDYLREAIQVLSPKARRRHVFTHTGWREMDGEWVYLTSGGAVGHEGFEVDLGQELTRYSLPREPEDQAGAMEESLKLLRLAPLRITLPLWAVMFRAPLASIFPCDLSLWLEGQTGSLKSPLAALFLSHFGDFERTHLPGAWSSTANQLEKRAFALKDLPFVVDDFAPSGNDRHKLESTVARLLRSQGNLAGRGRLRADLTDRPAYYPRGIIISTGEGRPPGQSLLARMLIVEVTREDVNLKALTAVQRGDSRLPHAMAGYVLWLAPQIPKLRKKLAKVFEKARRKATARGRHLRIPEVIAHLWLGMESGFGYAEAVGACPHAEAETLRAEGWEALTELAAVQSKALEEERPSVRFFQVLANLLTQGKATIFPREQSEFGNDYTGRAEFLGWHDKDALYLLPAASFRAVSRFWDESGEPLAVRPGRLLQDLGKEGLTECATGRNSYVVKIKGKNHRVLKVRCPAVAALLGEEFPPLSALEAQSENDQPDWDSG